MNCIRLAAAACAAALIAGAAAAQPAPAASAPAPVPGAAPAAAAPTANGYRPIAPAGDILATLQASGEFTQFVKAVNATNLAKIFKTQPNITVFAPTDAAFAALPPAETQALFKRANVGQLQRLVTYHIINARLDSAQIKGHAATPIPTVAGVPVTLDGTGETITVNGDPLLQADVMASNGVIHVVGKVLTPPGFAPPGAAPPPAAPAAAPASPAAPAAPATPPAG